MKRKHLDEWYISPNGAGNELLKFAMADLNLSARAYDRILKVARTIPDLAGAENIVGDHVSEAIQYRWLERQLWPRGSVATGGPPQMPYSQPT